MAQSGFKHMTKVEQEQIKGLWEAGLNDTEISRLAGFSVPAIYKFRQRKGLASKVDKSEIGRAGGLSTKERHGSDHYQKIARARWDRALGRD